MWLTVARLFVGVGLVAGLALATAAEQVPVTVALAQVFRRRVLDGVGHAHAVRLLDGGEFAAGRRGREHGKTGRYLRARDVVHADGQQRNARALVSEGEINALLGYWDRTHLRVDDHLQCHIFHTLHFNWKMRIYRKLNISAMFHSNSRLNCNFNQLSSGRNVI